MRSATAYSKKNPALLLLLLFALIVILFSCTNNGKKDETCKVCLDEKPETTDFTRQLNAINHFISVDSAIVWVRNFRNQYSSIVGGQYKGDSVLLPHTETFNLKIVDSIIAQPETIGLRIYLGLKSDNKVHVILAGVDANGDDAIRDALGQNTGGNTDTTARILKFAGGDKQTSAKVYLGEDAQRHP